MIQHIYRKIIKYHSVDVQELVKNPRMGKEEGDMIVVGCTRDPPVLHYPIRSNALT